jgi:pimeloyl-ACP methyl ester carboxylesterase
MYVEMRIPAKQTHRFPIIMVHGGTRTGTTYTGTPDGRESWAQYFARRGYAVYVVDQPGRGRSGYSTEAYGPQTLADGESGQRRYLQQEKILLWPQEFGKFGRFGRLDFSLCDPSRRLPRLHYAAHGEKPQ